MSRPWSAKFVPPASGKFALLLIMPAPAVLGSPGRLTCVDVSALDALPWASMMNVLDGPVRGNLAAVAASAVTRFFPEYPVSSMND